MVNQKMVILGSTGSIGRNSLEIAKRFNLNVEVLVAGSNIELLNRQIEEFKPKRVVIGDEKLKSLINHKDILTGEDGILRAIEEAESEIVINSLVGFAGLKPTLKSLELGKKLALANKESLVVAGAFLDVSKINPIDSEHFGLWYLLNGRGVEEMTLTASGGAFRDWNISEIFFAKKGDALKHPNWSMGNKITVDSGTMVNKLFELLEAKWLFDPKKLTAFIEPSSTLHALVRFVDGSTTAHFSGTDMKLPIAFALFNNLESEIIPPIDLLKIGRLDFREIEVERYPVWQLREELLKNPKSGVILNSANDFLVNQFLRDKISFGEISNNILRTFDKFYGQDPKNIDEVFEIDLEVKSWLKGRF
jgi:1-deoxy-D-xylulose-5-phosphate reductoisomerase